MSSIPTSDTKKKKDSNSSSKKKDKSKKPEHASSTHTGALGTIPETSDDDSKKGKDSEREKEELSVQDDSRAQEFFYHIMESIHEVKDEFRQTMLAFDTRLHGLELSRNLSNYDAFSTPTHQKKKNKKKKKNKDETPSLLQSLAASSVKRNWKEDKKNYKETQEDEEDDEDEEEISSSSDSSSSSSSSSEDSSSSDKDSSTSQKKKKKKQKEEKEKRNSSYGKLFQSIEASERAAEKTIINITRVEKECKVRIHDFKLANVSRAIKSIIEFQDRESTKVNMGKVLSSACKKHLKNKHGMDPAQISTIKMHDLFRVIASETRVHSMAKFYSELQAALAHIKLTDWDKVNPNNHESYYFQQLNLAEDFMTLFKFMLQENKRYCPAVDDKENGLIRLFRSFHSKEYWKYLWSGMKKRYKTMQEFMDEYLAKALEQYELSTAMQEIPYSSFGNNSKRSEDKVNNYFKTKRAIANNLNNYKTKSKDNFNDDSLHNLYYDNTSSSEDSDRGVWKNANPSDSLDKDSQDERNSNDEDSISIASNETKEELEEYSQKDLHLAAFASHENKPKMDKSSYACLRKLLSGKCENINCPYGHRSDILIKGAEEMKSKLKAFTDSHKTSGKDNSGGVPYKILHKEKYGKS